MSDELSLEQMLAAWNFQDEFTTIAIELVSRGAHLGALSMAKHLTLEQIRNGNRTLNNEELLRLTRVAEIEVREETTRNIKSQRGN